MSFSRDSAVQRAKEDLAQRLRVEESDIHLTLVSDAEFPDSSLGTPVDDEMAAQMISSGWKINLKADGEKYEYRADKYQLRLREFNGTNYVIES